MNTPCPNPIIPETPMPNAVTDELRFAYRNYRGEVAERRIKASGARLIFGATKWHPEPQWLMNAFDLDKNAIRDFAWADIIRPAAVTPQPTGTIAGDEAMNEVDRKASDPAALISVFEAIRRLIDTPQDEWVLFKHHAPPELLERARRVLAVPTTAATPPAADVTGEAGEIERLKKVAVTFFRWWWNQPGNNTDDGFDQWAAGPGAPLIAPATRPVASGDGGGEDGAVNLADLNRMFANIPAGPYSADARGGGWEVRAIDTDPANKHHWPYRLCASIPGQKAGCDPDVFGFIAGVINAWPQIAVTRPPAAQGEVEKVQEAFSWAKKRVAEAQALQAQIDRLTKERDEARAQFDAHDELLHQCLDDRDAYRQRAIKGEAERDEATHTLDFVEKHLTARLEAAEAALASMTAERDRLSGDLARMVEHFGTWANDRSEEATTETWGALYCARETLRHTAALATPQADAGDRG